MQNIQVVARVRPLSEREAGRGEENVWTVRNNMIELAEAKREHYSARKMSTSARTQFFFDYCYSAAESNAYIYSRSVRSLVLSSLKGINGTVFMYGQTGSGKTYTMLGYDRARRKPASPRLRPDSDSEDEMELQCLQNDSSRCGVLVMALEDLFTAIGKDEDKTYTVKCSYVQIYNEAVYDLLAGSREKLGEALPLVENEKKEFQPKGANCVSVSNIEEVLETIRRGEGLRHYARTTMNHRSSRSHTVFRLHIHSFTNEFIRSHRQHFASNSNVNNREIIEALIGIEEKKGGRDGTLITEAALNLVDLAGSEKIGQHTAEKAPTSPPPRQRSKDKKEKERPGERIKEGKHINKSLFFLMQVISLKAEGKPSSHIPYRNSSLTKILRGSLGGNARTLIVLCVTPTFQQVEQSVSTLRFGTTAKKIENWVEANIQTHNDQVAVRMLILEYEKKIQDLENCRNIDRMRIRQLKKELQAENQEVQAVHNRTLAELQSTIQLRDQRVQELAATVHALEKLNKENLCAATVVVKGKDQSALHLERAGLLFREAPTAPKLESTQCQPDSAAFLKRGMQLLQQKLQGYQRAYNQLLPKLQSIVGQVFKKLQKETEDSQSLRREVQSLHEKEQFLTQKLYRQSAKLDLYERQRGLAKLQNESLMRLQEQLEKALQKVRRERHNRQFAARLLQLNKQLKLPSPSKELQKISIYKEFTSQLPPVTQGPSALVLGLRNECSETCAELAGLLHVKRPISEESARKASVRKQLSCSGELSEVRLHSTQQQDQSAVSRSREALFRTDYSASPPRESQQRLFQSIEDEISSVITKVLGFQRRKKSTRGT